jgi:hypothetical protein
MDVEDCSCADPVAHGASPGLLSCAASSVKSANISIHISNTGLGNMFVFVCVFNACSHTMMQKLALKI